MISRVLTVKFINLQNLYLGNSPLSAPSTFAKVTADSAVSFLNVITYFILDINFKNHLTSERMFTKIVNELTE